MSSVRLRALVLALALLAIAASASANGRYDPRLRFRTIRTAHFDVHAHQGEEPLARRLAVVAERVRASLEPTLGLPHGRVQVILVDQTDVANGWATPFPYDAIEINAAPPSEEELIGNTTDWIEVAFTHEYTHILHLDRSRGFMRGARVVFGRAPLVFANLFLPTWQIEGYAVYEESRVTGDGRIPAGDFRAILDTQIRERGALPLDRANGGLDEWPSGQAPYAYGAYFNQYLSDRFGPESLPALADATAGRLPLFGSAAFKRVFGESLGDLWRDFEASRAGATSAGTTDRLAQRLTRDGFIVAAPRVADDGGIYYRTTNADGFPALMRLDGSGTHRMAWRTLGDRTSVRGDWIVYDAVERARVTALYSDLYAIRRAGGSAIRLTREARASQPDLSPDGRQIVCVVQMTGRRALAMLPFSPAATHQRPVVWMDDGESDYGGPRWSPDGHTIVAERRRRRAYELVLVDSATGSLRVLLTRRAARLATPSWSPDGTRVIFAAAPHDRPFNIYTVDVRTNALAALTDAAAGAQAPEMTGDGSLIYVGYSADGYDLFSLAASALREAADGLPDAPLGSRETPPINDASGGPAIAASAPPSAAYNPLRTLVPTYWQPEIASDAGETLVGAGTAMTDALGRHAYAATAAWSMSRARPDWSVSYAYDRWRPTLFAAYSDDTDPVRGGTVRTRELFAGASLRIARVRWSQTLVAGFDTERDRAACEAACRVNPTLDLRSVRGGWMFDSRRIFPRSISVEEGGLLSATLEASRASGGADGAGRTLVIDARGFHRVFSPHTVLAVRIAAASSWSETGVRRLFAAGGSGSAPPAFNVDRDAIGLLRGFDAEDLVGPRAAVINLDLRVPLLRVQRGAGTWPVFVRAVHAAAFVDAGEAWDAAFRGSAVRRAVGAELATDLVLFYDLRLTLAAGVSRTHDPASRDRLAPFARVGYAF